MKKTELLKYAADVVSCINDTTFFNRHGEEKISFDHPLASVVELFAAIKGGGRKIMFIGNGGSATIASHMAEDYTNCAGIRAVCFNDAALLTCLANDYSFGVAFARAVEIYADPGDILVAISSSGESTNILKAVDSAKRNGCRVITLSGFKVDNPLSRLGHINIYVPSSVYGVVEIAHTLILHAILDHIVQNQKPR